MAAALCLAAVTSCVAPGTGERQAAPAVALAPPIPLDELVPPAAQRARLLPAATAVTGATDPGGAGAADAADAAGQGADGSGASPAAAGPARAAAAPPAEAPQAEPVAIVIPKIGVANRLVPVGLNPDRSLEVPDDASVAGWYTKAPRPGDRGPAIIAGHNTWKGRSGIFLRLHELGAGDVIQVQFDDGSTRSFTVDRLEQHPKDAFPTRAVYGNTAGPELRVITCGGYFDPEARSHVDNIIAFARLSP